MSADALYILRCAFSLSADCPEDALSFISSISKLSFVFIAGLSALAASVWRDKIKSFFKSSTTMLIFFSILFLAGLLYPLM